MTLMLDYHLINAEVPHHLRAMIKNVNQAIKNKF